MKSTGMFPTLRRHPGDIKGFPERFETLDNQMDYREYVVLGTPKKDNETRQICTLRVIKSGIDGGTAGQDINKFCSEYAVYRIKQNFEFIKLSPKDAEKLLKADLILNSD